METDGEYSRQVAKQADKQHIGQSTSKNIDWRIFKCSWARGISLVKNPTWELLLQWNKKAPSYLLDFAWYSASENVEEPWSREMTTVPSSTC